MNDPHVVSLGYRLKTGDGVSFKEPPPLKTAQDDFDIELSESTLTVTMRRHYPTIEMARVGVERFLQAWELDTDLRLGFGEIRFEFQNGEVVDRDPSQPGELRVLSAGMSEVLVLGEKISGHVTYRSYPVPPTHLEYDLEVQRMWERFKGHLNGREPLPGMAYFCLTVMEQMAGSRAEVGQVLNVSQKVMDTIGRLTSEHGNLQTARKVSATKKPLTTGEEKWLISALKVLIRRTGERKHAKSLPQVTMSDLPQL